MDGARADGDALGRRIDAHRREIERHCYRMLGAAPEAQDATQETFLRAWQARGDLETESALRPWLYRIATNVCLDLLRKRGPRVMPHHAFPAADGGTPPRPFLEDALWVGPFPTHAPPNTEETADAPDALHERAEHVALAFVAALQHLTARQRAVLLLRDVVELSAEEAATVLESSPAAVEAALARARATVARRREVMVSPSHTGDVHALLERYVSAWHRRDSAAFSALLAEDASFVMPPTPVWFHGRDAVVEFVSARLSQEAWRLVATSANGLPAFGLYRAVEQGAHVAHGIQVLELSAEGVQCIHTFLCLDRTRLLEAFGLPARLDPSGAPVSPREK